MLDYPLVHLAYLRSRKTSRSESTYNMDDCHCRFDLEDSHGEVECLIHICGSSEGFGWQDAASRGPWSPDLRTSSL